MLQKENLFPEGKIDIHGREQQYQNALKRFKEDDRILPKNKKLILEFLKDCENGKTATNRAKKNRCHKT